MRFPFRPRDSGENSELTGGRLESSRTPAGWRHVSPRQWRPGDESEVMPHLLQLGREHGPSIRARQILFIEKKGGGEAVG